MQGMIFNIQRFSIDDGPGIRTTVFLKGCSLKCIWCHNPESIETDQEIQFFHQKCNRCGRCVEICTAGAQICQGEDRAFLKSLCAKCGKCTEVCWSHALKKVGQIMTVDAVLDEVEKDRDFYRTSQGGVTFSGGEPLLQIDYLKALLMESKHRGLHTAVDTAGHVSWKNILGILPYVDLFLFDVKAIDEELHKIITGASNKRILENLEQLSKTGKEIWIRIPFVPGINLLGEEVRRICDFLRHCENIKEIEILPYHKLGENKYSSLQMNYACTQSVPPDQEQLRNMESAFRLYGLTVNKKLMERGI